MLSAPTPYPYVGSYALYVDHDARDCPAAELVRIMWRGTELVAVSFPLRGDASGNKSVPADQLIDPSPLTSVEAREFHDLDRALWKRTSFRSARLKAMKARRDALHQRIIYAPVAERLLKQLRGQQARQQARRAA